MRKASATSSMAGRTTSEMKRSTCARRGIITMLRRRCSQFWPRTGWVRVMVR
ncbi:Uncharacterised protein [Bordetella pertussis]|nr:Uncharacterised protein [Bordetella pertussis]